MLVSVRRKTFMSTLIQPSLSETAVTPAAALVGVGTAVPPLRMPQQDALNFILNHFPIGEAAKELYRRAMRGNNILTRHFALGSPEESLDTDLNRMTARFERAAVDLSV